MCFRQRNVECVAHTSYIINTCDIFAFDINGVTKSCRAVSSTLLSNLKGSNSNSYSAGRLESLILRYTLEFFHCISMDLRKSCAVRSRCPSTTPLRFLCNLCSVHVHQNEKMFIGSTCNYANCMQWHRLRRNTVPD
jgi:hypothetical protein